MCVAAAEVWEDEVHVAVTEVSENSVYVVLCCVTGLGERSVCSVVLCGRGAGG